ncbi:MAG: hypothetical protein WDN06_09830 [Asticcacaulis sp.]
MPFFRRRAAFYFDGFNLYHAVDAIKRPYLKWLNLKALGRAIAPSSEAVKRGGVVFGLPPAVEIQAEAPRGLHEGR